MMKHSTQEHCLYSIYSIIQYNSMWDTSGELGFLDLTSNFSTNVIEENWWMGAYHIHEQIWSS